MIEKYGKKQKPVKMAAVDESEELTIQEVITMFHDEYLETFAKMMRAIRLAKNNQESAFMAQKALAPNGFRGFSGPRMMSSDFRSLSAGAKFEYKGRTLNTSYRYLTSQAKLMYDPFSHEFDDLGDQSAAGVPDNQQQEDHSGDLTEMVKHLRNTDKIPDAWPEDLKDIPIPTDVEIIGYLYDEERKLKEFLEIEEKEPGLPYMTILKQQLIVGGLRIIKNLVEDCREEPEESEQSPLPIMRNNDQRKEWLRNYKAWGLWYTDEHIGVRYYKYDFENGARLIAEEYDPEEVKDSWWTHIETSYMHLVGGPEPDRKNGIPKWTYHSKYNRHPNSETELVEFLKEVQK